MCPFGLFHCKPSDEHFDRLEAAVPVQVVISASATQISPILEGVHFHCFFMFGFGNLCSGKWICSTLMLPPIHSMLGLERLGCSIFFVATAECNCFGVCNVNWCELDFRPSFNQTFAIMTFVSASWTFESIKVAPVYLFDLVWNCTDRKFLKCSESGPAGKCSPQSWCTEPFYNLALKA